MARFDIYANRLSAYPPFLMQVQSDFHAFLPSRVVVPLVSTRDLMEIQLSQLTPMITVKDETMIAMVPDMTSLPRHALGSYQASAEEVGHKITAAIDFLMQGF